MEGVVREGFGLTIAFFLSPWAGGVADELQSGGHRTLQGDSATILSLIVVEWATTRP